MLNQDWGLWKNWVFYHCSTKIVVCWSNFTTMGHLIEDSQEFLKDQLITYVATSIQWNERNFIYKKEEEERLGLLEVLCSRLGSLN